MISMRRPCLAYHENGTPLIPRLLVVIVKKWEERRDGCGAVAIDTKLRYHGTRRSRGGSVTTFCCSMPVVLGEALLEAVV
jgi:hypothetical protein